jgi:hypothetical protein
MSEALGVLYEWCGGATSPNSDAALPPQAA